MGYSTNKHVITIMPILIRNTFYQITGYYRAAPQIEERIVTDFSYEVRNIPYEELMFESMHLDSFWLCLPYFAYGI